MPIGEYWFLYALFAITILYWLFRRINSSATAFVVLGTICVAVELSGQNTVEWNVAHDVASFLVFFAAGVAVSRGDLLAWFTTRGNAALAATCLVGYADNRDRQARALRMGRRCVAATGDHVG